MITMRKMLAACAFAGVALLAACGGGGGTSGGSGYGTTTPPMNPAPAPQSANVPVTKTTVGTFSNVLTSAASGKTLYTLSADTAGTSTCAPNATCVMNWPLETAGTGATAPANFTIIAGSQWAYNGHPLYTYVGDTAAGTTAGEGIPSFGGTWHVATTALAQLSNNSGSGSPPSMPTSGTPGYP